MNEPVVVPPGALSDDALTGVIDAFILREGTDYGHRDIPIEEKRARVRALIDAGRAEILYYPDEDYVDLQLREGQ